MKMFYLLHFEMLFLKVTLFIVLHSEFTKLDPYIGAIHTLSILGIDNFQHNNNNVFLLSHTILNWEDK